MIIILTIEDIVNDNKNNQKEIMSIQIELLKTDMQYEKINENSTCISMPFYDFYFIIFFYYKKGLV